MSQYFENEPDRETVLGLETVQTERPFPPLRNQSSEGLYQGRDASTWFCNLPRLSVICLTGILSAAARGGELLWATVTLCSIHTLTDSYHDNYLIHYYSLGGDSGGGRDPHLNTFLSIYYFCVLIKWRFFSVTEYFSLFLNSFVIADAHSYT